MIYEICHFNETVLGISGRELAPPPAHEFEFIMKALYEEANEIEAAYAHEDLIGFVDGVLDLCYFAIGGLARSGLTPDQIDACFKAIHQANMTKKKGVNAKRDTGAPDAIKPQGWQDPKNAIGMILFGGE